MVEVGVGTGGDQSAWRQQGNGKARNHLPWEHGSTLTGAEGETPYVFSQGGSSLDTRGHIPSSMTGITYDMVTLKNLRSIWGTRKLLQRLLFLPIVQFIIMKGGNSHSQQEEMVKSARL